VFGVQALVGKAILVGKPAFVDRFVLERHDAHDAIVLGLHDEVAAQAVVRAYRLAPRQLPGPRRIAERFRGQRTDGTQIDYVSGKLGIDRFADEGNDLGVLAATDHAELHDAGDLLAEANAARAMDAARHVGRDER